MPRSVARLALVLVLVLAASPVAAADGVERRGYETRRVPVAPKVDGRIDDEAWQLVEWTGDFLQREPTEGVPPSKPTSFKVVYDDDAIYFAFRAYDDPAGLRSLLSRRDRFPGDWVEVNIDSYNDRRTAFSFTLSLSGTRGDEFISQDGNRWDGNWDPVWQGATNVDDEGWTAEMRIPLSQLRFGNADKQSWGLQVQRRIHRLDERSTWQVIPKNNPGWVSRFGELRGVDGLKPARRLEMLPYVVGKAETFEREEGNPFRDGSDASAALGLDGKVGIGSNLTLDFTLNPDFGQVEADPSEVNLTAFETFFEEKRPFFIERADIFENRVAPAIANSHYTQDRQFYSRRIGGVPPHEPDLLETEYADVPNNSSILGAFKLTGKTAGGLSIGVLDSVTSREAAEIDHLGVRRELDVAPLTNAFVGRVQQDLRGGDTLLGFMGTSLVRDLDQDHLQWLPEQAWSGGVDFAHYFLDRRYLLEANVVASRLSGSAASITEAQTSSARYFQRPDNEAADLDPTRTSLDGHGGSLRFRRTSTQSNFSYQTGAAWRSPGFDLNSLGFMNRADEVNQFGWAGYQFRNPIGIFRRVELNANEWVDWDTSGQLLRKAVNTNMHFNFLNAWRLGYSLTREWEKVSNTELRGGPSSTWPGRWGYEAYGYTDERPKLQVGIGSDGYFADEDSGQSTRYWMDVRFRPTNALTLTLNPSITRNRPEMQYVDTVDQRYLFGALEQKTSALTVRLDFSLTPNLTLQYYGAPFVSSGRYSAFKNVTAPRADAYRDRFVTYDSSQVRLEGDTYAVDEDSDGTADFTFGQPDFDVREFNSTLVARWEYRPGSLFYVVWSQARSDEVLRIGEEPGLGRGLRQLFDVQGHDVFLIKFSTWLPF
jgi:hypothetical protein